MRVTRSSIVFGTWQSPQADPILLPPWEPLYSAEFSLISPSAGTCLIIVQYLAELNDIHFSLGVAPSAALFSSHFVQPEWQFIQAAGWPPNFAKPWAFKSAFHQTQPQTEPQFLRVCPTPAWHLTHWSKSKNADHQVLLSHLLLRLLAVHDSEYSLLELPLLSQY